MLFYVFSLEKSSYFVLFIFLNKVRTRDSRVKEAVQKLANTLGITIRIAHYPAYCSKYNPIEHRLFPHVTRALSGVVLDSVQTVKALIESRAKTKKGLETYVNIVDKIYETGKKASELFMENMPIVFDQFLPKWNYKAVPVF